MAVEFRFAKDFDYVHRDKPGGLTRWEKAYKAGTVATIPEAHAAAAEAAGAGERVAGKRKPEPSPTEPV